MKRIIGLYFLFCVIGSFFEWCYGKLWSVFEPPPWIYPGDFLQYTSLRITPLWGLGALVFIYIHKLMLERSLKNVLGVVIPLIIGAIFVAILANLW